jgi:hypothetical protein
MARSFGKVYTSIWDDDEFRALSPGAQRLYVLILSQKRLTLAGVVPYAPRSWARSCDHLSTDDIEADATELMTAGFVIIDRDTQELMVRTLLKHNPIAGARTVKGLWNAWSEIDSTDIRWLVVHNLPVDIWDTKDVEIPAEARTLVNTGREGVSHGVSNRSSPLENQSETNQNQPDTNENQNPAVDGRWLMVDGRWLMVDGLSQSTDLRKTHPEHVAAIERAFFEACYSAAANAGIEMDKALTGRELGKVQGASTDVLRLGATPDEVHVRVNRARGLWSDSAMVTPKGVAGQWAQLAVTTPVEPSKPRLLRCPEHDAPIIHGVCQACKYSKAG